MLTMTWMLAVITEYLYEALALGCQEMEQDSIYPVESCIAYGGTCLQCSYKHAFISTAFYISFFLIGQFVLLTVFLAILFHSSSMEDILSNKLDEEPLLDEIQTRVIIATYRLQPLDSVSSECVVEILRDLSREGAEVQDVVIRQDGVYSEENLLITKSALNHYLYQSDRSKFRKWLYAFGISKMVIFIGSPCYKPLRPLTPNVLSMNAKELSQYTDQMNGTSFQADSLACPETSITPSTRLAENIGDYSIHGKLNCQSKLILKSLVGLDKPLYWFLVHMSRSLWLELLIVLAVLTGTLLQAFEPAGVSQPSIISREMFDLGFLICSCVFAVEFSVKVAAFGIYSRTFNHQPSYLQNSWHVYDSCILILTIFTLVQRLLGNDAHNLQQIVCIFRTFSLLRPMRRIEGINIILDSLLSATRPIMFALMFLVMIMTIFGVMGMSLFADKFRSCNNRFLDGQNGEGQRECCGVFLGSDKVLSPQVWSNPSSNFDSFSSSLLSLSKAFKIGWIEIWFTASDITGLSIQPKENENIVVASIFFMSYMVCVSFFSVTVFTRFICDGTLSAADKNNSEFSQIQKNIDATWPVKFAGQPNRLRQGMRVLLKSAAFSLFSSVCMMLNLFGMSLAHRGQDSDWEFWLNLQDHIFFGVFAFETFLGLVAWGPTLFLKNNFQKLDLLIVCVVYIVEFAAPQNRKALQILRLLRIYRVFRLAAGKSVTMRAVFNTLEGSLGQAINICAVLTLFLVVFATIAVQLFGATKFGQRLGSTANFYTVSSSMLTLIQILFGDELEKIVDDCGVQPPLCTKAQENVIPGNPLGYSDCGSDFSIVFFVAFTVVCDFTCMNLFVGYANNYFCIFLITIIPMF